MHAIFRTGVTLLFPVLVLVLSLVGCAKYDELAAKDQICQHMRADVEAQVQRRADPVRTWSPGWAIAYGTFNAWKIGKKDKDNRSFSS